MGQQWEMWEVVGEASCRLAEWELAHRRPAAALTRVEACLADFERMSDVYEIAVCRRVRGQTLVALGRVQEAIRDFDLALEFFSAAREEFESLRVECLKRAALRGEVVWDVRAEMRKLAADPVNLTGTRQEAKEPADVLWEEQSDPPQDPSTQRIGRSRGGVLRHLPDFPNILGTSSKLRDTLEAVTGCAPSRSPVLLEGETGTGKELIARAIHDLSPRASAPFVPFNCATSTPDVFDAEICGHVRGAFTGALGPRIGLARAADGGTLFLDEIAELNSSIQPRLLRLLDIGEVRPVGSDEVLRADVRIVAATHEDMDLAVQSKAFRADLFFRLSTFRIRVPSLRERLDDLPILVEHFAEEARRNGYPGFAGVSTTVISKMAKYDWPGNLRELRNEVIRLAQRCNSGEIARQWRQPDKLASPSDKLPSDGTSGWERAKLVEELGLAHGRVATVARRLGISRARVYRMIKEWNLNLSIYRH